MQCSIRCVLACTDALRPKVTYVFDTLFLIAGIKVVYQDQPPSDGPWLFYGAAPESGWPMHRCVAIPHGRAAWEYLQGAPERATVKVVDGVSVLFPATEWRSDAPADIGFDLPANAFYFLTSWHERRGVHAEDTRHLFRNSVYRRLGIAQDVVDRYLAVLVRQIAKISGSRHNRSASQATWVGNQTHCTVLSHDVDFLPNGMLDNLRQGAKTVVRHLLKQRSPMDAARAGAGLARALAQGRDPYGCVHELMDREQALGVSSSIQVAVAHRHPNDVNYDVENAKTRDYLQEIVRRRFDLCLHGSYRSTEDEAWYREEVEKLGALLARPLGNRQHFLSFDYDRLFRAQERSSIQYDMSIGYPDQPGPRAGISHPFFPYDLEHDRPYGVLEIPLFLMDVTLRGYLDLDAAEAWPLIASHLEDLARKKGCVSVVWHPIVFGGARDPGYADLFWKLVQTVRETNGIATDARTVNTIWRQQSILYPSFSSAEQAHSTTH